jgi:hypothetical protein
VRLRAALSIGTFAALLVAPTTSHATLTLGPDLASLTPSSTGYNCSALHDCTLVNGSVGAAFGSRPLVSPVSGSIEHLRLRTGPGGAAGIIFRLLRPVGGGAYKSTATFGVVPPSLPPNSTTEFPRFPIEAGEAIGIDCCEGGGDNITTAMVPGSGNLLVWGSGTNSPLGGSEARIPDSNQADQLLMLNADIEPEIHFILDKVKVKGKRVIANATVPNPGVLSVGSKLLKHTTVNVTTLANSRALFSTPVRLSMRTTRAGRARLRRVGKLKLKVTYTASFGTPTSLKKTVRR